MTNEEREQFGNALGQTLSFYDKKLDPQHMSFWLTALKGYDYQSIRAALIAHVSRGKYAPRPADIVSLIKEIREQNGPQYKALPNKSQPEPASEEVRRAWTWLIRQWGGCGETMFADPKLTESEVEEALLLVNQQSFKSKKITAIPEHCFLESIWGCSYEEAMRRYENTHDNEQRTRRAA